MPFIALLFVVSLASSPALANYDSTFAGLPKAFQEAVRNAKGYMDQLPAVVPVRCMGGNSCCRPGNLCGLNDGDCDGDEDCAPGLRCGLDKQCPIRGAEFNAGDDCCEYRKFLCIIIFLNISA